MLSKSLLSCLKTTLQVCPRASFTIYSKLCAADSSSPLSESFVLKSIGDFDQPTIGRTDAEHQLLYLKHPEMPPNPKTLKISILGVPNSGKSTLVNRILNRRISAVSSKINTTKNRISGVLTENDIQLIVLDTPGLLPLKKQKKFNLERSFIVDPHSSLWESDLAIVVHDVGDEYARGRIDREILKCLFTHPEKETILVLNKIDKVKNKQVLLDLIAQLTGGRLNNKSFVSEQKKKPRFKNAQFDYDAMFARTAEQLKIKLKNTEENSQIVDLMAELKECEDFLLKNLEKIKVSEESTSEIEQRIKENEKARKENLPTLSKDNLLEKIKEISPVEFKKDLMQTTDWHLYYQKLSSIGRLIHGQTHWPYFNQVFMTSASQNDGVEDLRRYLLSRAQPGPWVFSRCLLTDQMPRQLAEDCVREKMLEHLPDELGYVLQLETVFWEVNDKGILSILINVIPGANKTSVKRQTKILLSNGAMLLRRVAEDARQELERIFRSDVRLKLNVKV